MVVLARTVITRKSISIEDAYEKVSNAMSVLAQGVILRRPEWNEDENMKLETT